MKPRDFLLAACCLSAPGMAADGAKPEVVAFRAGVLVEVDAAGKPVKVDVPADLPSPIREYVAKRVASWQYQPARVNGVPQPATTYVGVNACAVPVAGGYRLGLDFDGNGPRTAGDRRLVPPRYPSLAQHAGTEAEFMLILGVERDGSTVIDQIVSKDIAGRRGATEFEPLLRRWIKTVRFDPERVAGQPVRGQVRMPVYFRLRHDGGRQAMVEELQAKALASRECRTASGEQGNKPVALAPVVTVVPLPAG